jgi:hypothetical protein
LRLEVKENCGHTTGSSKRIRARHCFMLRRNSCTASALERSGSMIVVRASQ